MKKIPTVFTQTAVIVAGGASGIGEELVRQLEPTAKHIVILDRNKSAGEALATELGAKVTFRLVDMTDAAAVEKTLQLVTAENGAIDYFFNCAGSFLAGEIRDTPLKDWRSIFDSNILPIAHGTHTMYAIMRRQQTGHIINIASSAGLFPVPIMNIYGATKAAVVSLTLGLRMEAKDFGIKVSVVCPTIVETPLYDTALYAGVDKPKALKLLKERSGIQQPDTTAYKILRATAKNKAVIHTATSTKLSWAALRLSVPLYMSLARRFFTLYRDKYRLDT